MAEVGPGAIACDSIVELLDTERSSAGVTVPSWIEAKAGDSFVLEETSWGSSFDGKSNTDIEGRFESEAGRFAEADTINELEDEHGLMESEVEVVSVVKQFPAWKEENHRPTEVLKPETPMGLAVVAGSKVSTGIESGDVVESQLVGKDESETFKLSLSVIKLDTSSESGLDNPDESEDDVITRGGRLKETFFRYLFLTRLKFEILASSFWD